MTQRHIRLWNFLWERSEGVCRLCLKPLESPIEIDHIVPRASGGGNDDANLQLVHRSCNRRKRALPMSEAIQRITTQPLGHRPKLNLPFVHLVIDEELLERIDDFRYAMRIPSRNAAIRWLLTAALDQNPIPEPDWEKHGSRDLKPGDPKTPVFDQPPKQRRKR